MKKKAINIVITLLLVQIFSTPLFAEKPPTNKHVIGCYPRAGLFSIFFSVLNDLAWCERNGKIPVVNWETKQCAYYQKKGYNGKKNPWDYYFLPVSRLSYTKHDKVNSKYVAPDDSCIIPPNAPWLLTLEHRRWVKTTLLDKFIKLRPALQKRIDDFYRLHLQGKNTIGIHLRGTDKHREEAPVSAQEMMKEANSHLNCQYFVATDDERLLNEAIKNLRGHVVYHPSTRSKNGRPIHLSGKNRAKLGEEVIIEAYLLSRCDHFIHTVSNVSSAILILNPELESTLMRMDGSKLVVEHFP